MSSKPKKKVAEYSKALALKYCKEKNFSRAFSHFLVALKLMPDWKLNLKEDFLKSLCVWGATLESEHRFDDLFKCYELAIEIFPDSEVIFNNLGAHLLRCGYLKEAVYYFRQSLAINSNFIQAFRNIDIAINLAVERWHFRMLNDRVRNEAFRKAIKKKIELGYDTVLDVGTGSGILSLFCIEGKAKHIFACDSSPVMIEIARDVFQKNKASEVILIGKHSTSLQVPKDIPTRVSLLVTETVDAGLLGENILHTLTHAWDNLLLPPRAPGDGKNWENDGNFGLTIPLGAHVYVAGIECDAIRDDAYLKETADFGDVIRISENYDTRNLRQHRFKFLTAAKKIITIDFNKPDFLKEVLEGRHDKELKLEGRCFGRLDCLAVWFDLLLDEEISLNTGPWSKTDSAWDQAIFFPPRTSFVDENEEILLKISFKNGQLKVKRLDPCDGKFQLSEDSIKILNDENLMKGFEQAQKLLESDSRCLKILDLFRFPAFGLNFLQRTSRTHNDELVCVVPSPEDRNFVQFLAKKRKTQNITILEDWDFGKNIEDEGEKFDLILVDFFEPTGELRDGVVPQLHQLRTFLKAGGLILPEKIEIYGQLVYSDWLLRTSKVIDDRVTCGYQIGGLINAYQTRHFIDLDAKNTEKVCCSDHFQLLDLNSSETPTEVTVRCFSTTPAPNALIYWFKIKFLEKCDYISTDADTSLCRQAGFFIEEGNFSEKIKVFVIRGDGLFRVELLPT